MDRRARKDFVLCIHGGTYESYSKRYVRLERCSRQWCTATRGVIPHSPWKIPLRRDADVVELALYRTIESKHVDKGFRGNA